MKRRSTLFVVALLALIGLFAALPRTAMAAEKTRSTTYITPSDTNGLDSRIDVYTHAPSSSGGSWFPWGGGQQSSTSGTTTYEIYLPGCADPDACFLEWEGEDVYVYVNGDSYISGQCPIPPVGEEWNYYFWYQDNQGEIQSYGPYPLVTYQGSEDVQAVFIEIDESEGTIAAMNNDSDHETTCTGEICIDGTWYTLSKMKGRGNVTWNNSSGKKPYNLTLGKKINWPGIDSKKTKKWSILAEPYDESLLGNRTGFNLAYQMGIGQDTTSADVWMNGEYLGCYTVTAKTDSFVTDDGYMLEDDNYTEDSIEQGGDPQFRLKGVNATNNTGQGPRITVKKIGDNLLLDENGDVDESAANLRAVSADIQAWMQEAWDAIRSETGYNSKGKHYSEYIDVESFAKMYLMHEYVKSFDIRAGSILFYRDGTGEDDLLYAGPIWDLDNAMGSTQQNGGLGAADDRRNGDRRSGEGDFISNLSNNGSSIYQSLGTHLDFMLEVYRQYQIYRDAFNDAPNVVEQLSADIAASAKMNHKKVTKVSNSDHNFSSNVTLGSGEYRQTYLATSSSPTVWENYLQNLYTYVSTRSKWFNNNYNIAYSNTETDGWASLGGKYLVYLKDGEAVREGLAELDGNYYYLKNFKVVTNAWIESGGKYYYFGSDGKLATGGWITYNGASYYIDSDCSLALNRWVENGGKYYYFDENAQLVTNDWKMFEGKWYYFGSDGQIVANDWRNFEGKWYYFDENGQIVTNAWKEFDGKWCYFGSDGLVVSDLWFGSGNYWYYIKADGTLAMDEWVDYQGHACHFNAAGICDYADAA